MIYPDDFLDQVCSEYPDSQEVREAAFGGKYGLGVHLAGGASMRMSPEDIVASIDRGDCAQVREEAARAVRRRRLHAEWMRIVLRSLSTMSGDDPAAGESGRSSSLSGPSP